MRWMPRPAGLLLALILSAASAALGDEAPGLLRGYRRSEEEWGAVLHHPSLEREEGRVAREVREALARVEERLGRRRGRRFTAVLAAGPAEFGRIFRGWAGRAPEEWIAGVAFPGRDLLLVRRDVFAFLEPAGGRPAVLEHELAHLVVHGEDRGPGSAPVPRWLDEGIAQWAARSLPDPQDEAYLSGLARLGALYSLEKLEREVPVAHDQAALAYQQCLLLVDWMVARFGDSLPSDVLRSMDGGTPWREALASRTGMGTEALEAEFRRWLAGRRSLGEVLLRSVNFWTVTGLLAVLAAIRGAARRRRQLREMADEPGTEEIPPPPDPPSPGTGDRSPDPPHGAPGRGPEG